MTDDTDYSVDDLIRYLGHGGLTLATLSEMDHNDLCILADRLHHWNQLCEMELRNRTVKS